MATIQDVAKAAGVSAMTVSNVINGHPNVRRETRDKVLAAMARLDYRVNVAARNLRKGRTGTIGLAVPEVDSPYYSRLAAGVIAAAGRHGLRVGIEQTGATRESELDALSLSRNRLYDGLLLSAVGLAQTDAERLTVEHPVVVLGDRIVGGPVDHVGMPNLEASRAAVAHLVERGCRRIALVCGETAEVDTSSLRHAGYRQALTDAGVSYDPELVREVGRFGLAEGARCARDMVAGGLDFDGVFCVTDTLAMGVLRGLADSGVQVPGQVKVIGFDDIAESAYLVPSLSSVDPDHDGMAERAVALLLTRIDQHEPPPRYEEFVSGFTLVIRESTGGPQGETR
ncbi:LacI family DNA-binding transcriptional regulator [Streptomyces acidiscabies]|uniref:LacI family transcriptional regulator n=1 Tax=Streptomyces acidiscabies TaxID=42234 RepID=A0A0L0JC80_9ACTN|nr:LacI family DNA-binding transcriptional regulator [Streptomyces acidiscabies]KND23337.1 LacI family transcriptional regulator [Streptomyces acidiscabies]